jgi:cell wall-associated NlpC family hydrolase
MGMHQKMTLQGNRLLVEDGPLRETHEFPTAEEAASRAAIVAEALTWVGTPFRNCADVKGRGGGIDCAMLLVRSFVDTGRLQPFEPRPYPPDWYMHHSEERFLGWIEGTLGARRVEQYKLADVLMWRYGRCFSHGGIVINTKEIVHAYGISGMCLTSRILDDELHKVTVRGVEIVRPRLAMDVWSRAA